MGDVEFPGSVERLLAHTEQIRTVARRLLQNEQEQDDVIQETLIQALEHPPRSEKLRGWLSVVARNVALRTRRGERRRVQYEALAARSQALPDTTELVVELEMHRRLVEAVAKLKEPYRSTVLLRFFRELGPSEIARRAGIPVETVRTRLKWAFGILRQRLEQDYGGDRSRYLGALFVAAGVSESSTVVTAGIGTGWIGALVMSAKLKIAAAIVTALAVGGVAWYHMQSDTATIDSMAKVPEARRDLPGQQADVARHELARQELVPEAMSEDSGRTQGTELVEASRVPFAGRVTDKLTGDPVASYLMELIPLVPGASNAFTAGRSDANPEPLSFVVEDERGEFYLRLERGGRYSISIRSPSYLREFRDIEVPEDSGLAGIEIPLDPGLVVSGRVVQDATGEGIQDALVAPASIVRVQVPLALGEDLWQPHAMTDEEGRFRLAGLDHDTSRLPSFLHGERRIAAVHPEYAEGVAWLEGRDEPVEIRLRNGHCFYGKVLDDVGRPAPGVMVRLSGNETPFPRPVLSGADGSYRTPPCGPGRAFLQAGPPPGTTQDLLHFTEETKQVTMGEADVEVNFGPSPKYVTWRGTFYDAAGTPVAEGAIELVPSKISREEYIENDLGRLHRCDELGHFEIGKLSPGSYRVLLFSGSGGSSAEWGTMNFEYPGLVEHDLFMRGAEIRGTIVDASTGEPFAGKEGRITASNIQDLSRFACEVEQDGTFALRGLRAGVYLLEACVPGFPDKVVDGLKLEENQVLDGLRLELSSGGMLELELRGFVDKGTRNFALDMRRGTGNEGGPYGHRYVDESGEWRETFTLTPGRWSATLQFGALGTVNREFEIVNGGTAHVIIRPCDLSDEERQVSVICRVSDSDGAPVPGLVVGFNSYDRPASERSHRATTDEQGGFLLGGLRLGNWHVYSLLPDGTYRTFPDIHISASSADPYPLNLVLARGIVACTLCDRRTGLPFTAKGPQWGIYLLETTTRRAVCEFHGAQTGERFVMQSVPQGEYFVTVWGRGYEEYRTPSFVVAQGRTVDLGKIFLDPCGVLVIEVCDTSGIPIEQPALFWNGNEIKQWERETLGPGKFRCISLALGAGKILVKAEGFASQEIPCRLELGQPATARVELTPK